MFIKLNEIPEEGKEFDFDQRTSELAYILNPILKGNPFEVHLRLQPMGSAFEARGHVGTELPVTCAFCAKEFNLPVHQNFHDLLLSKSKTQCDIKGLESEFENPDISVTEIKGNSYAFGDYLREMILLAEPFQVECRVGCKGLCSKCGTDLNEGTCPCSLDKSKGPNAFSILKSLKLD